jgi:hypothetical protein
VLTLSIILILSFFHHLDLFGLHNSSMHNLCDADSIQLDGPKGYINYDSSILNDTQPYCSVNIVWSHKPTERFQNYYYKNYFRLRMYLIRADTKQERRINLNGRKVFDSVISTHMNVKLDGNSIYNSFLIYYQSKKS